MVKPRDYPLGYSEQEAQRLEVQASRLDAFTEDVLRRAGLRPGMRVLDLGSGVGDVSWIAARIVGPEGAVVGLEKAESSVEAARHRARERGLRNVEFEVADLTDLKGNEGFDATVGRFILLYLAEPAALLRKLSNGVVAFIEHDMSQIAQGPTTALFARTRAWVLDAFAASGAELDMGSKLYATFVQAGLSAPTMFAAQPVVGGPACPGYADLTQALRSLLPKLEERGVVTHADVDLETLADRLRVDAAAQNSVLFMSRIVGAWSPSREG